MAPFFVAGLDATALQIIPVLAARILGLLTFTIGIICKIPIYKIGILILKFPAWRKIQNIATFSPAHWRS
jgi:hypothetical protein